MDAQHSDPQDKTARPVAPSIAPTSHLATFRCTSDATSVHLVGEFNAWSTDASPMILTDDGFEVTVPLEPGIHRYRFFVDGLRWENDTYADDYAENPFGGYDSVRVIEP